MSERLEAGLAEALDPRASVVVDLTEIDLDTLRMRTWNLDYGTSVVQLLYGQSGTLAVVRADGGVSVLAAEHRELARAEALQVVPVGRDAVLVACPSVPYLLRADDARLQVLEGPTVCVSSTLLGGSEIPDKFVVLQQDQTLALDSYRVRGSRTLAEESLALTQGDPRITGQARFAHQRSDGAFGWVSFRAFDEKGFLATSDSSDPVEVPELPDDSVSNRLAFVSWQGGVAFSAEPDASTSRIDVVDWSGRVATLARGTAPPNGFSTWGPSYGFGARVAERTEANRDEPSLRVPRDYLAQAFSNGNLVTAEMPLTPCRERDACRALGESYLLGVTGFGATRVAFYAVWTWEQESPRGLLTGIYALPVEGDGGTSCEPNQRSCADASTVRRCNGGGTAFVEQACTGGTPFCVDGVCAPCQSAADCPAVDGACLLPACTAEGCAALPRTEGATCTNDEGSNGVCDDRGGCSNCVPEQARCDGANLEICSADGSSWSTIERCPISCSDGACVGPTLLVAGGFRSCSVVDGEAWCWGDDVLEPARVTGLGNVTAIAVGQEHACAANSDQQVLCWGVNTAGQLGRATTSAFEATPAPALSSLAEVTSLVVGYAHTCAADATQGKVECWGQNDEGQLGSVLTLEPSPQPILVPTGSRTNLVAGGAHTCAFATDAVCFGRNGSGQAGDASLTTPAGLTRVPLEFGPVFLAAGNSHSCAAASSGSVTCWGENLGGQLGRESDSIDVTFAPGPGPFTTIGGLTASGDSSCVLADGEVWCWGRNQSGQLGRGTKDGSQHASAERVVTGATQVSLGYTHACAVVNGGVQCWGNNQRGQLGTGDTTEHLTPVDVAWP